MCAFLSQVLDYEVKVELEYSSFSLFSNMIERPGPTGAQKSSKMGTALSGVVSLSSLSFHTHFALIR